MNISLCLWTAIWASGKSVPTLWPWLVRVGFFSLLFSVLSSAVMLLRRSDTPIMFVSDNMKKRLSKAYAVVFLFRILQRTKRSRGMARVTSMLFAMTATAMLAATLYASYSNPGTPRIVELHNVHVLRDIGRYSYWFQSETGAKFYSTFCADYEPQFSEGQTLTVLKYEDRGVCWSVANTHPAYLILRDDNGKPIVR